MFLSNVSLDGTVGVDRKVATENEIKSNPKMSISLVPEGLTLPLTTPGQPLAYILYIV
jgi:hypothetical protein